MKKEEIPFVIPWKTEFPSIVLLALIIGKGGIISE